MGKENEPLTSHSLDDWVEAVAEDIAISIASGQRKDD